MPSRPVTRSAGELLPHRFTLTSVPGVEPFRGRWRSVSVALSAGRPAWALPSILPCGVRTFLDPRPATRARTRAAAARPTPSRRSV